MGPEGAVPARRVGDVDQLVRRWADEGVVKRDVAARFVAQAERQRRRRTQTWVDVGSPRRRRDEPLTDKPAQSA